ncbi:MAG: hypothetical protein VSS75_000130, partial [Candidatus Parabeggiatoa sp.]|nr:hypothetical protein [Candidatus Parabeggiatoa sp.]
VYHPFDVIKVKAEKSRDLIKKHSLMCKLLTLKADDRKIKPDELVYEIYRAAAAMKDQLTNEQLLLIEQWVNLYKKVSEKKLETIKKEVSMSFVETTNTEHGYNQGWIQGEVDGEAKGEAKAKKEMAINLLKMGIDVETIWKATGLEKDKIKQLSRQ